MILNIILLKVYSREANFYLKLIRMKNVTKNILIEKHKSIFSFIQKNACSSMKAYLVEILEMQKAENFPLNIHNPRLYPFPCILDEDIFPKYEAYFRFCIIRNPWERLVSCYKEKVMNKPTDYNYFKNYSREFYGGMPFDEFVNIVVSLTDEDSDPHFGGQLNLLTSPEGRLMANYFCNLENLNEHLNEISQITGMPFSTPPQLNVTKKSAYQDFYTPELVEKVRKRFRRDIEFFNFKFGKKNTDFPFGFIEQKPLSVFEQALHKIKYEKGQNKKIRRKKEQVIANLNKEIEDIHNSLSWKITSPLRKIVDLFKSKK